MTTALYRRYRPETFADVIGQEHVTDPLMAAIDKDRINHAYLFSGPRGCGKTTSARILARCLNCAQGPTSTPCGTCDSCVELARNGSGSLDVIEIDAASHGGVDDARDLRERATFAPVRDRFKIFIIDEAHMVTSAGFNALLKIVEEPPEHILFIFATTEPDKVIGTIRSRTHHYPFRLVPPEPLMAYLDLLCRQENVPVAPGVLSLVIRAGGGSVRDSLSVLDQLMAGAGENGLDYELAVSLLGYTHATLLDDVVDSIAAGDAGTVFNAVDRVIQTGHDPRRFVEDLLERFRDLIVINAVPEGAASILRGVPDDQLSRMRTQAAQLGAGELSRAADVTNTALTEMTGATSPRLHLELLCARLLLPAADATERGTLARVDRIERRLEYAGGSDGSAASTPAAPPAAPAPATPGTPGPAATGPAADLPPAPAPVTAESAEAAPADAPAAPARPRLDVPRTAEEAAARWSLPAAGPDAPAVPSAVPGAHSPAIPSAVRPPSESGSSDWGASWGVSNSSAFAEPEAPGPASAAPKGAAAEQDVTPQNAPVRSDAAPQGTQAPTDGVSHEVPAESEAAPQEVPGQSPARPSAEHGPSVPDSARATEQPPVQPQSQPQGSPQPQPQSTPQPRAHPQPQTQATGGTIEMVRRAWPEIMDEVAQIKRATWLIVNVSAKPRSFDDNQLVLAFANQGNAIGFQRGPHVDNVKQAIHKVLGLTCSIEAMYDAGGSGESGPKVPGSDAAPGSNPGRGSVAPSIDAGSAPTERRSAAPTATGERIAAAPGTAPEAAPRRPVSAATRSTPGVQPQQDPGAARADVPDRKKQEPSRTDGRPAVGKKPTAPSSDATGAWDPSMSDDSWALVEPPEEAFDPGGEWDRAPEDAEQHPAGDPGMQPTERSAGTRAPRRSTSRGNDPGIHHGHGSHQAPAQGPAADGDTPQRPAADLGRPPAGPPGPDASRSVVWSPDLAPAPRRPEQPGQPGGGIGGGAGGVPRRGPVIPSFITRTEDDPPAQAPPSSTGRPSGDVGGTNPGRPTATGSHAAPPHPGFEEEPAAETGRAQRPTSRYQQLLDAAERKRAEEAAHSRGAVDLRFVEDEPSADDETLEESGLVGRTAIERILNGRLVEERSVDGQ